MASCSDNGNSNKSKAIEPRSTHRNFAPKGTIPVLHGGRPVPMPSRIIGTKKPKPQWARSKKVIPKIPFQNLSLIINGLQTEKMQPNFDFKKISCPSCLSWTNPLQGQEWARSKKAISKIPFQNLSLIINGLQKEKYNLVLISKKFRALRAFRGQIPSKDKNGRGPKRSFLKFPFKNYL